VDSPIYEIQGSNPDIVELYDDSKEKVLIEKIEGSEVDAKTKEFLKVAATRLISFHYGKIAEFYAHADEETQELMENLALVIIDFDKAIELGYVKLKDEVLEMFDE
jgi:hypothetical protein